MPRTVLAADFNGDGQVDVAIVGDRATVLLGRGDLAFKETVLIVAPAAQSAAAADFNGDGRPDLALVGSVGPQIAGELAILLGNGDGTFQAQRRSPGGIGPLAVVTADFNGDTKADVAILAFVATDGGLAGSVSVALGNGDGTFGTASAYPVNAGTLAVGDIDGDGKRDLVAHGGSEVVVLRGRGDGTFTRTTFVPAIALGPTTALLMGDLDGDRKDDLLSAHGPEGVRALLSNGDGSFREAAPPSTAPATTLAAADLDGDGHLDLVAASTEAVVIVRGRGDGTFSPPVPGGAGASAIALTRLDADLAADLVLARGGAVVAQRGRGDGTFVRSPSLRVGQGAGPLTAADFDGDQRADAAVGHGALVSILRGQADGTFSPDSPRDTGAPIGWLQAADLNTSGRADLLWSHPDLGTFSRALNAGAGSFGAATTVTVGAGVTTLLSGRFDGDEHLDLVARTNAGFGFLTGDGAGGLAGPSSVAVFRMGAGLTAADYDGDARLDLAMPLGNSVGIFRGNGDGSFGVRERVWGTDATVEWVSSGDLDGDGHVDLVVSITIFQGDAQVHILLGAGDGTFHEGPIAGYPVRLPLLRVIEANGDNKPDVVAVGAAGAVLFLGTGDGSILGARTYAAGADPRGIVAADFDGDGRLDLAVSARESGDVTLLRGTCAR